VGHVTAIASPVRETRLRDHDAETLVQDRQVTFTARSDGMGPSAQLVVNGEGIVVHVDEHSRARFGLTPRDIGRALGELELADCPFDLCCKVERAYAEGRPTTTADERWTAPGRPGYDLELSVVPLFDGAGRPLGASLRFTDVSRERRLQEKVERATRELETAIEEVQTTNQELEAICRELQSTSQELHALREEGRARGEELGELDLLLEAVLTSFRSAVAVVDRDLRIRKWSHRAEDLWGLRSDVVLGTNFLELDIGLPVDRLRAPISACLAGETGSPDVMVDATNRRGRPVRIRVTCTPLGVGSAQGSHGVILLMEATNGRD
jgi:two-component system CheB/CheR fusion protein